jgi:hypothetical protein
MQLWADGREIYSGVTANLKRRHLTRHTKHPAEWAVEMLEKETVAATALSSASILAALVSHLRMRGVIGDLDVREIYEGALLMLETAQATSTDAKPIFAIARELVEEHLRR